MQHVEHGYKLEQCACTYKKDLYKGIFAGTVHWAWRQLWLESKVAEYLRSTSHDLAVAMELSIYPPKSIATTDIRRIKRGLVLRTANNDAGGYTDGLYVGKPQDLSVIMNRFMHMHLNETNDYEHQLKRVFEQNNLATEILEGYATPFKSFNKFRHTGRIWGWAAIDAIAKDCLELHRPDNEGGVRGGLRGGPLHPEGPEDALVAVRFRAPTCIAGEPTNFSVDVFGLVPAVAYQVVVQVKNNSGLVFAGDMLRIYDLLWEGTIPRLSVGDYIITVDVLQFCPGIPEEEAVLSHVVRAVHCVLSKA